MNIEICIENLGLYNEGILSFEWVQLPTSEEELKQVLKRIGINKTHEEWFIADYSAPFKIDEYDNIFELNELVEELEDIDENILTGIIDAGYELRDAIEIANKGDYYYIKADDETDLAYNYIDEVYGDVSNMDKETLASYFDYEAFGRDLSYDFTQTEDGFIQI